MNIPEPCPFCGEPAERVDIPAEEGIENAGGSFIHCTVCGNSSKIYFGEKEGLLESWNRRQPTPEAAEYKSVTELAAEHPNLVEYLETWDPARFIPSATVAEAACRSIEDTRLLENFLKTLNQLRDEYAAAHPPKPTEEWMREAVKSAADIFCNYTREEDCTPQRLERLMIGALSERMPFETPTAPAEG